MNEQQLKPVHTGEPALEWQGVQPFQLVSLLDMLRFHAHSFVSMTNFIAEIQARFTVAANETYEADEVALEWLKNIENACKEAGLDHAALTAARTLSDLKINKRDNHFFTRRLEEIKRAIETDLMLHLFFIVPRSDAKQYYTNPKLFGESVFDKFPLANLDIEESGKCFALGRYTACVMHLQRVTEIGLKGFGTYLGIYSKIKTTQPAWQNILDLTGKEIKDRTIAKSWGSAREQEYAEGIQSFLVAVKTAWRNPSMHADRSYGEEITEDIYNAVKGFMRHLAEHLDEQGTLTL